MPPAAQSVTEGLQLLTHWILILAVPLAGIGALSMALIQTAKNMLPLRRWFQRNRVENWLAHRANEATAAAGAPNSVSIAQAKSDLVHLATAGDASALYSLPIEQLCGQINASTQVLLDYPSLHWNLLRCLASEAHPPDLALLNPPDPAVHAARKMLLRKPAIALTDAEHNQVDDYVAARNRVSHQIQRAVDALQISVSFRWKFWMQLASILLSAALGVAALLIGSAYGQINLSSRGQCGLIVLTAILSGFLAPVARDLVAALEQIRT
ncbi:MAG TPA: hypothetical protein VKS20_01460 [Candidatus Acidoferrales bacterium]|nr:hypothetical protein [Candidatus Acidoferrales bacterium]